LAGALAAVMPAGASEAVFLKSVMKGHVSAAPRAASAKTAQRGSGKRTEKPHRQALAVLQDEGGSGPDCISRHRHAPI